MILWQLQHSQLADKIQIFLLIHMINMQLFILVSCFSSCSIHYHHTTVRRQLYNKSWCNNTSSRYNAINRQYLDFSARQPTLSFTHLIVRGRAATLTSFYNYAPLGKHVSFYYFYFLLFILRAISKTFHPFIIMLLSECIWKDKLE